MKSRVLRHNAAVLVSAISLVLAGMLTIPQVAFAQDGDAIVQEVASAYLAHEASLDDGTTTSLETAVDQGIVQADAPGSEEAPSLDETQADDQAQAADLGQDLTQSETSASATELDENIQQYGGKAGAGYMDAETTTEGSFGEETPTNTETPSGEPTDEKLPTELDLITQATNMMDGVDISGWNPYVDLSTLPGDFVIIKATEWNKSAGSFTSYNTGLTGNYSSYIEQANAALAAGKRVGFYHFATNPNGGRNSAGKSYVEQAAGFLDAVKDFIGRAILCLDWENAELSDGTVYSVVESDVAGAKSWLDYVYERTGIKPLIYMNKTCAGKYDWSSVANAGYELWGAQYLYQYYPEDGTINGYVDDPELRDGWGAWGKPRIYQYTSKASMAGSGGEIDVNKFYGSANDWDRLMGSKEHWIESEGSYYYVYDGVVQVGTWVVTPKAPNGANIGYQRYWLDATGKLAVGRVINSSEAGYNAYARPEGYVVRGAYAVGDKVYLADNDGRLASAGWVVSSAYGQGVQRYWIDAGSMAAIVGLSSSGGWDHYTRPEGYVVRGMYTTSYGYVYLANNDGKLEPAGWIVSDKYGYGLQRYYIDAVARACIPGYSEEGWNHYTTPQGYVARGRYVTATGDVYIANNEGRLTSGKTLANGWLVTADLGQGLQRYWVENGDITFNKLIKVSDTVWAFARPEGYVVRGRFTAPNGCVYLANNDGVLEATGWLVSGNYGQGLQRYYIDAEFHACVPGYSTDGWKHYTTTEGYVLRGATSENNTMRYADNDGKLAEGWVVTNAFGQGLQRYWQKDGIIERNVLVKVSNSEWTFCRPEGYVVRGKYIAYNGYVYLANNDGRLENVGWVISNKYDGDWQRYYIDADAHAAIPGYSTDGWSHFTTAAGYVLRGAKYLMNGSQYAADNEGKLTYVTTAAKGIANAAKETPIPSSYLDSDWVADVLTRAGFIEASAYDGYAFQIYYTYCDSQNKADLKAGMLVSVPRSKTSSAKEYYGAVGIALGDGTVMQLDNMSISTMTVDAWIARYGDERTPKWGWLLGTALT